MDGWDFFNPARYYNEWDKALEKIEPAWAKAAVAFRGETRFGHGGQSHIRAMSLVQVREVLDVHRRRYEAGHTLELLAAVKTCADENVPLPGWLALAFNSTLDQFTRFNGAQSLDTVFRSETLPTDTAKKAAAARQDWQLGGEIMMALWDAAHKDESLQSMDAALDRVLQLHRFGVGKTKARKLFNMVEKVQIEHLRAMGSNRQPLSRIFEKRRKNATT